MTRRPASSQTISAWITNYPDLSYAGVDLQCKVCDVTLSPQKSVVVKHIFSKRHQDMIHGGKQKHLNLDLVKFMVGCNIPWAQLSNPVFREFISNCVEGHYAGGQLLSESTLRKVYLPQVADEVPSQIRRELAEKPVWVSVDLTTNARGVKFANILVGAMDKESGTRGHLMASKKLHDISANSISSLVSDSLKALWKENFDANKDKFLLFITEPAAYMKAAARLLLEEFNFLHLTCLARALHRVAETVKECYPNVDLLITSVQKLFHKAPERKRLFSEMLPNVELPPEPILTKCCTWLEAARYYFVHLEDVKLVLQQFDPNEAAAVAGAQAAISDPTVQESLQKIHNLYSRIPLTLRQLEQKLQNEKFSLTEELNLLYDLQWHLFMAGESPECVKKKFEDVLKVNPGLPTLCSVVKLLNKEEVDFEVPGIHRKSLQNYTHFRYAPVTSVDVERTCSMYKWMLSDRRCCITSSHLEQILIIYFYYRAGRYDQQL